MSSRSKLSPRRPASPAGYRAPRAGQAGSAYIIALLVLVVLTIIGLALTLVTQTEVQVGASERTANRSFYATDSGINIATQLNNESKQANNTTFLINTTGQDLGNATATTIFADQVTVTPLIPINVQPCNLCDISSKNSYSYITHLATSNVSRLGFDGSGNKIPIAQKTVVTMIGIQPELPSVEQGLSGASQTAKSSAKY